MDIILALQEEFGISKTQAENTVNLLDEGNTIPFIARYRKELTGSLDDQVIRSLSERLQYLRNLEEKREFVLNAIKEQEKLTEEIEAALDKAKTITEIEDIYRPYRPKRRTRATIAVEKGLKPLADIIMLQLEDVEEKAKSFVNAEKEVEDPQQAIEGALDIIAEEISDNADNRAFIRKLTIDEGVIITKAVDEETKSVYEMYYDYSEPVSKIASHRVLAVNRGENEKILSVKLEAPVEKIISKLCRNIIIKNSRTEQLLTIAAEDA